MMAACASTALRVRKAAATPNMPIIASNPVRTTYAFSHPEVGCWMTTVIFSWESCGFSVCPCWVCGSIAFWGGSTEADGFWFVAAFFWTGWPLALGLSVACRGTGDAACKTTKITASVNIFMAAQLYYKNTLTNYIIVLQ